MMRKWWTTGMTAALTAVLACGCVTPAITAYAVEEGVVIEEITVPGKAIVEETVTLETLEQEEEAPEIIDIVTEEEVFPEETYLASTNVSPETAEWIPINTLTNGRLETGYSNKWYKFTLTNHALVNFQFGHEHIDVDSEVWNIILMDSSADTNNPVNYWDLIGNTGTVENAQKVNLVAGTYYLRINASRNEAYNRSYTIQINPTYITGAMGRWEQEPNDGYSIDWIYANGFDAGATETIIDDSKTNLILTGDTYHGMLQGYNYNNWGRKGTTKDKDYYRFTLTKPGTIHVTMTHTNGDWELDESKWHGTGMGQWDISIENKEMLLKSEKERNGGAVNRYHESMHEIVNAFTTKAISLEAGTYYLIIGGSGNALNKGLEYTVKVDYSADDRWMGYNNTTQATAKQISLNKEYAGSLYSTYWYSFILDKETTVQMNMKADFLGNTEKSTGLNPANFKNAKTLSVAMSWYNRSGTRLMYEFSGHYLGEKTQYTGEAITLPAGIYYGSLAFTNGSLAEADYSFSIKTTSRSVSTEGNWKWDTASKVRYVHTDGSYTKNGWEKIDGIYFHFDQSGYMETGWIEDGGKWYYLGKDGAMVTGWQKIGKKWYYFTGSGAMVTGWKKIGKKWYYMDKKTGAMKTGWVKDGKWYYMDKKSGAMKTGWVKDGKKWYFMNKSGHMKTGWVKSGGKWYYMDGEGRMISNTSRKIGKKTYRFDAKGVCKNP